MLADAKIPKRMMSEMNDLKWNSFYKSILFGYMNLIDPITGLRFLPEGCVWMGSGNNVEEAVTLDSIKSNVRDLKARVLLLTHKLDYLCNSRLVTPTHNKYLNNNTELDKLPNSILRHVNGVVKNAVSGVHYTDVVDTPLEEEKVCVIDSAANSTSHKLIRPSNLSLAEIINNISNVAEIQNNIQQINNDIEQIETNINNVNNTVNTHTTQIQNINNTINEHSTEIQNINNTINNISREVTNIENTLDAHTTQIQNIDNSITNINTTINNQIDINADFTADIGIINAAIAAINNQIIAINAAIVALQEVIASITGGIVTCGPLRTMN